jgi:hypothetical protein
MWQLARTSIVLFLQGRLFKDPGRVMLQMAIGILFTALIVIGLTRAGVPLILATAAAGFFGGMLQPLLFRNLKYR